MRRAKLVITEHVHRSVWEYLHPGDGLEAAGVILCNQGTGEDYQRLVAADFLGLPYDMSERRVDFVSWPFEQHFSPERIAEVDQRGQSIVTIHSHPSGYTEFSDIDNTNDRELFSSINNWFDDNRVNGAAIMTPDGVIHARAVSGKQEFTSFESVCIVGTTIQLWKAARSSTRTAYESKLSQTFGEGTLDCLRTMRVGVVGCSGTGSIAIELLARNAVGELVIVDDDALEEKNLNRVVNATLTDAAKRRPKVDALRNAIAGLGLATTVNTYEKVTDSPEVVCALVDCDVIFGCVDSAFGRYHLECLANAYLIPYFDVGVHIEADGQGGITSADAVAHYVHPDGTSLLSRGVYTMEQVMAEDWKRTDPGYYNQQRVAGYLAEVGEEQPAVMSLNMQAVCMAFNDFMARIHSYRLDENEVFGTQRFRLVHGCYENEPDMKERHPLFDRYKGTADASILVRNNTRRA